jgi:hypothetical protein
MWLVTLDPRAGMLAPLGPVVLYLRTIDQSLRPVLSRIRHTVRETLFFSTIQVIMAISTADLSSKKTSMTETST